MNGDLIEEVEMTGLLQELHCQRSCASKGDLRRLKDSVLKAPRSTRITDSAAGQSAANEVSIIELHNLARTEGPVLDTLKRFH